MLRSSLLAVALSGLAACDQPDTVDFVDLDRYDGQWFEIASYPTWFQEDCTGTTATYAQNGDGTIAVFNECFIGSLDGEYDAIEGTAYVEDTTTNAKLKVVFDSGFPGDYWILELGDEDGTDDYPWAVVGSSTRYFLWILSRTSTLDSDTEDEILGRVEDQGTTSAT